MTILSDIFIFSPYYYCSIRSEEKYYCSIRREEKNPSKKKEEKKKVVGENYLQLVVEISFLLLIIHASLSYVFSYSFFLLFRFVFRKRYFYNVIYLNFIYLLF